MKIRIDDYLDGDVAYFLGLVIGRGTIMETQGLRQSRRKVVKTLGESAGTMSFSFARIGLCIGLAALLGGLLLAFVLLMANASAVRETFASATYRLPDEGSAPVALSVNPPSGTLDGITIDPMEEVGGWYTMTGNGAISATLTTVTGHTEQAIQLNYNLGVITGTWVQLRRDFSPPLDLSAGDHLRFFYRGATTNTLQIGLVSAAGENYFSSDWAHVTHAPWWTYATWDFQDIRKDDRPFTDTNQIKAIFISVKKSDQDDIGGFGSLIVDELQYLNIVSRTVPSSLECVTTAATVTQRAAAWIAAQQQPGGLLKSWQEETADYAWLYDQALGLIVLSESGHITQADQLAATLHTLQNDDGSWYGGYHYSTTLPISSTDQITPTQPVGANAWMVYALARYDEIRRGPSSKHTDAYTDALECASWLMSLQLQRSDGSLPALPEEIDVANAPTEPNLDAWWAFQATGYQTQATKLQTFLLDEVWDNGMGRFKSSRSTFSIFLDNQTWGAPLLRAVGREQDARKALSYARWTLAVTSSDGQIYGFDGAGPFSVWNEGTLQYIAAQGENSQYYWNQMVRQQAPDGGMPGSPDNFKGHIVWLTRWHGIAPTSWLYFAGTFGPFPHPYCCIIHLPIIFKNFGP